MKKCHVCGEEFENYFSFCPIDGTPLEETVSAILHHEFNLTLIGDDRLAQRLVGELQSVVHQVRRAWPSFKNDPVSFTRTHLRELKDILKQRLNRPFVATGSFTSIFLVFSMILSVLLLEKHAAKPVIQTDEDNLEQVATIDFQNEPKPSDSGIGKGQKGRIGFENARGEGSRPDSAEAARGGGGGGNHDQSPQSQGRVPLPSVIQAPIPTTFARLPPQALPEAGIDIDPALWRNLQFTSYGDPRSKTATPSNGAGEGGGVGTNNGTGIGEGSGPGVGPGEKGNIGGGSNSRGGRGKGGAPGSNPDDIDRVYRSPEVTERARVLSKPEPQYTEEARRNQISGTVILRVVFSRTGEITNIRAIQTLQYGLTEKAIAAARQIRFVPATRNGRPVSVYMQLEYNFNLY